MAPSVGTNRWLSVEEIAEHLGVSKATVYMWLSKGNIPAQRIGRLWKFKAEEVDAWVRAGGAAETAADSRPNSGDVRQVLGHLKIEEYLHRVRGRVLGRVITDAKDRAYRSEYLWDDAGSEIVARRADGNGDSVSIPKVVDLDQALVAFFGLYSGDGAKGTENPDKAGRIEPIISFSQREKHLVRFAVDQFRRIFPGNISFTFSLGEDSAYFMAGEGRERLDDHYLKTTGSGTPTLKDLSVVRPDTSDKDRQYLGELRPDMTGANEDHLAFYYQHRSAMEEILVAEKTAELASVGIEQADDVLVTASVRRPFKKGAREPGGSSRSDEIHLGGLGGIGELFLKMMHEIEDTVLRDAQTSSQGLVCWIAKPSTVGKMIDLQDFFTNDPFGKINRERPTKIMPDRDGLLGQWRGTSEIRLNRGLRIDPLWCYVAGLYLAEGSTPKKTFFRMFGEKPEKMAMGFTSSEGASLELMLRTLRKVFSPKDCLKAWKVKVGNQYFPELVVTGLKHGVAMLRGGDRGEGKLRTMEVSLAIKQWALDVANQPLEGDSLLGSEYADCYSHVEPTGAGVARIDFYASSTLCRWYFPLLMHTVFGGMIVDPVEGFC